MVLQARRSAPRKAATLGELARKRDGERVTTLAQVLLGPGIVAGRAVETAALIQRGEKVIFEASLQAGRAYARIDALRKAEDGWEAIEVKSATKDKPGYVQDLAYQVWVARRQGLPIVRAILIHVDRDYVWEGSEIPPEGFLTHIDVTAKVEKLQEDIGAEVEESLRYLDTPDLPEVFLQKSCCTKCEFLEFCREGFAADDVYYLPDVRSGDLKKLRNERHLRIAEIPQDWPLTDIAQRARNALVSGGALLESGVRDWLDRLVYPLHFIDFETVGPCFPAWVQMAPYQTVPFQWSNHVLEAPDAQLKHFEFLAEGDHDPRADFAASLLESLQGAGSVLVYTDYEAQRLQNLAQQGIPGGSELCGILDEKGMDLYQLIKQNVYHPDFQGSFSIKKVLPALCPDLGYSDLDIQEGETASQAYLEVLGETDPARRGEVRRQLLAYCERDTYAMVRLLERLREMAAALPSQGRLFAL